MIIKSILLILILIAQHSIIKHFFNLTDSKGIEKWGSLFTNLVILTAFTNIYLVKFNLFETNEKNSIMGAVAFIILVSWIYNYYDSFSGLFTEKEKETENKAEEVLDEQVEENVEEDVSEYVAEATEPTYITLSEDDSYLIDYVGFGYEGKIPKENKNIPKYLDDGREFSKHFYKNRMLSSVNHNFKDLYPKIKEKNPYKKSHIGISVDQYDVPDLYKYKVNTDTKYIPEKIDQLITI